MKFKAKLRRIGNSLGVLIPREVITNKQAGDELELQVITNDPTDDPIEPEAEPSVITPIKEKFNTQWCSKHTTMKGNCKCK